MKELAIFFIVVLCFLNVSAFSQSTQVGSEKLQSVQSGSNTEQVDFNPMIVPESMRIAQVSSPGGENSQAVRSDQSENDISPMLVRDSEGQDISNNPNPNLVNPATAISGTVENDPQLVNPTISNPKKSDL